MVYSTSQSKTIKYFCNSSHLKEIVTNIPIFWKIANIVIIFNLKDNFLSGNNKSPVCVCVFCKFISVLVEMFDLYKMYIFWKDESEPSPV